MYEHAGILLPIIIFNNSKQSKALDNIDSNSVIIAPNQMHQIDVCALLKKIANDFPQIDIPPGSGWPEELNQKIGLHFTVQDFVESLGYKLDGKGEPLLPSEYELKEKDEHLRQSFLAQVIEGLDLLSVNLKHYTEQDQIIQIHKEGRSDVNQIEIYEEINQKALNKFIQETYFPNQNILSSADEEKIQLLAKAYNLEFRLKIYKELLIKENSIVNYTKLSEDLTWARNLLEKINKSHYRITRP